MRWTVQSVGASGKVILFLTDGEPSPFTEEIGEDILQTVGRLNRQLDNRVVLLTYGIGHGTFWLHDGLITRTV